MKIITPNTNISPGSIDETFIKDDAVTTDKIADGSITAAKIADGTVVAAELADDAVVTAKILDANVTTAKIADDAVTLAKISTSGASDNQILVYDHSSTSIVWETPSLHYTDAEAIAAVEGEATLDLTGDIKMTGSPTSLVDPVLNIVTGNSGEKPQLMATDPTDDVWSQVGRVSDTYIGGPLDRAYQWGITLDPNNTKGRTGITDTGTGTTHAGDYAVKFQKNYADLEYPSIEMKVYGANDGFSIVSMDDYNGGLPAWSVDGTDYGGYGYKPINYKGQRHSFFVSDSSGVSLDNHLQVGEYGVSASPILVVGAYPGSSNAQWQYLGADTGVPEMRLSLWNVDSTTQTNIYTANEDKLEIHSPLQLASYTTTERDALSVSNGTTIYNETTDKFQGYAGGSWVDLN